MENYSIDKDAESRIASARRWGWFYYWLNSWLNLFSWIIIVAMPFGFGVMLYIPETKRQFWNLAFLLASAFGLLLQIVIGVFKLNRLAYHNIRKVGKLDVALTHYKNYPESKQELIKAIQAYIEDDGEELAI